MLPRFLPLLTLVFLHACEKAEEKPAQKVTPGTPVPERKAIPGDTPAPPRQGPAAPEAAAPARPAAPRPDPPTQEELDAYSKEAEAFVNETAPLVNGPNPLPPETLAELRTKLGSLMQKRGKLMRGMTPEQRKAFATRLSSLAALQQKLLLFGLPGDTPPRPAQSEPPPAR